MMRIILYLLILAYGLHAIPAIAQSSVVPPVEEFDEDEEEDEEDIEEPPMMKPPPMPSPFNSANPNAGGVPGVTRPPGPLDNNTFRPPPPSMGSAVGTMMANPSKVKFRVVDGEFYQRGKKRGRDPVKK